MESDATDLTHKLRLWKAHKEELELFKSRKLATKPKWGTVTKPTPEKPAPFTPSANRLNRQSIAELTPQKLASHPLKTPSVTPSRISMLNSQSSYSLQLETAQSFLQAGEFAKSEAVYQSIWASPYSEQASHDATFWDGWFRATNEISAKIPQPATPRKSDLQPATPRKSDPSTPLRTPSRTSSEATKPISSYRLPIPGSRQASSHLPTVPEATTQRVSQFTGASSKVPFFSPRKNVTVPKYRPPPLGTPRTMAAKRGEFLSQSTTPEVPSKKPALSLTPIADRLRKGLQQIDEDENKRREAALNAMPTQLTKPSFEEQALSQPAMSVIADKNLPSSTGTPKAMKMLEFGMINEKDSISQQVEDSSVSISYPSQHINEQQPLTTSLDASMPTPEPCEPTLSNSITLSPLHTLQQFHDINDNISRVANTFSSMDQSDITSNIPSSLNEEHCDKNDNVEKELSETLDHLAKLNSSPPSTSSPPSSPCLSSSLSTSLVISPPVKLEEKKLTKRKSFLPSTSISPPTPAITTTTTENLVTPEFKFTLPPSVSTRKDVPIIHTLLLPTFSEDELAEGTIALEAVRVRSLRKSTRNELANYDSKADMILSPVRRSARRKSAQTPDEIQALLKQTNNMYSPNPDLQPTSATKRLRLAAPRFPLASVKEETPAVESEPCASIMPMEEIPLAQRTDSARLTRTSSKMNIPFAEPAKRGRSRRVDTPRPLKSQPRTSKSTRSRSIASL